MEREIDLGDRLGGLGPRAIDPVQRVHCLPCRIDRIAAGLGLRLGQQRKDREHGVAHKFQYLPATRTQWGGECLEYLVEQLDDLQPRTAVGELCEPPHVGEPQHGADALDRAALDRSGMDPPPGIPAEIGFEEPRSDRVAGMRHHRQGQGRQYRLQ